MDRSMIDAASGGALMDKTPVAARHLISNMARPNPSRMVNEIGAASNQRLENQLTELTSLVRQLAISQQQPAMAAKICGICTFVEHPRNRVGPTKACWSRRRISIREATISNSTIRQPAIWKTTISAKPTTRTICSSESQICAEYASRSNWFPIADNLEFQQSVSSSIIQFQQNMTATIQDLKMQIGQLANTVSQLQSVSSSNLPSLTIPNPRGNASATPKSAGVDSEAIADSQSHPEIVAPLPFPSRIILARKPESDEEFLRMFQKVEINIPLFDAIKQIPKYAKFLKELCVHKRRKMKGSREIGGMVLALTKSEESTTGTLGALPKKRRDPGIFSVPCTIGECTFADAMLDLGASINVMPASIYRSLNFGDLEPTRMTIQLANRSIVQPLGVLEDVLVQVNELIFPADFYVLDMKDETSGKELTLILGRPFLMTARTKIDMHAGMLSMEFGDTLV
ncbi:hypothetical protein CR513_32802, partial [Mucuna pruriens]